MHEIHFRVRGMKRAAVNASTGRPANNHRHRRTPKIMRFCDEIDYLIEAAGDEIDELHFCNRTQSQEAHSASGAHDSRLADGSFDHTFASKFCDESFGSFERAAIYADVLPDGYHCWVAVHLLEHGLANSLNHGNRGHVSVSRVYRVDFDWRAGREGSALLARTYLSDRGQTERAGLPALQARPAALEASAGAFLPISRSASRPWHRCRRDSQPAR